ncbi:NAD kinase [Alicyclobacillus contaminans]|uniref:NAD(+)/NADH kinase n=1 Tax=Alicyclobacillus contaminans TaxID=392016 RepID=UPI00040806D1|nr:NAD(+)/NADH kinase [Alicyclobacillus contaminans]GMA52415.1 NAD kinase [Alicyclobacillus contaminans]
MRTVGIIANLDKPKACAVQERLLQLLHAHGMATVIIEIGQGQLDKSDEMSQLAGAEMAFVLGGDGTLLGVARQVAPYGVPLLGINIGHLGFLSEAEPTDVEETVRRVATREYDLESRLMLEASVLRDGRQVSRLLALNDVGIGKGSFARMVNVDVHVDDVLLDAFRGDGVIVSTPTGSTAYSLSCGGPIMVPQLQAILVTPICPHTLSTRPCVIQADQTVRLRVHAPHQDLGLTVDGQIGVRLVSGDEVVVRKAPVTTTLVKWRDREFFSVLRQKLHGQDAPRGGGILTTGGARGSAARVDH